MQGTIKALKLEVRHILGSKLHLLLLFVIPAIVVVAFASAGKDSYIYPGTEVTLYDYYAPGIFATVIFFITTQLAVLRIVAERAPYGTLDRDLLAISRRGMFFGKFLANMMVGFCQCILIFLIGKGIYDVKITGDSILVLSLFFLTALVGLSAGLLLSVSTKTKDQANQLVPFVILFSLVLSGIMIPLEKMPAALKEASNYLPLTLSYSGLKDVMLNGKGVEDLISPILFLTLWTAIFLIIGVSKFSVERK
jgi:ABC-2 type transport system permease protein